MNSPIDSAEDVAVLPHRYPTDTPGDTSAPPTLRLATLSLNYTSGPPSESRPEDSREKYSPTPPSSPSDVSSGQEKKRTKTRTRRTWGDSGPDYGSRQDSSDEPYSPDSGLSSPVTESGHSSFAAEDFVPWGYNEPYRTQVPTVVDPWKSCFERVQKIDDEMCKGWREQIDTLLIFAGLFSATVTAFSVEEYQGLQESPGDTLARLQLASLLNSTRPETFSVPASAVWINTLWFASLTLSLASVLVSILCKQWLYEYQRYENLTAQESFHIRELRYRGLLAWRVPMIISSLPLLLQAALVFFLVGLLILLWTLQRVVAIVITTLVGLLFIFLVITSILPALQYILPVFETQCAYKSSQSWTAFVLSVIWIPDKSWVTLDNWEIKHVEKDVVPALWRFYESFSSSADAIRDIYNCLLRASPGSYLATKFVDKFPSPPDTGIDALPSSIQSIDTSSPVSRRSTPEASPPAYGRPVRTRLLLARLRPGRWDGILGSKGGADGVPGQASPLSSRRPEHRALCYFLSKHSQNQNSHILNRHVDHCVRVLDYPKVDRESVNEVFDELRSSMPLGGATKEWDNAIASHLVESISYLFSHQRMPEKSVNILWETILPSLLAFHHRQPLQRTPYTIFGNIEQWLRRTSSIARRTERARCLVWRLRNVYQKRDFTPEHVRHTRNLTECVATFCNDDDVDVADLRRYLSTTDNSSHQFLQGMS